MNLSKSTPSWLAALALGLGQRALRRDRQFWLLLLPAAGLDRGLLQALPRK